MWTGIEGRCKIIGGMHMISHEERLWVCSVPTCEKDYDVDHDHDYQATDTYHPRVPTSAGAVEVLRYSQTLLPTVCITLRTSSPRSSP